MAFFDAVIGLSVQVNKALRDIERVERAVNKIKDTTLDIKVKQQAIKKIEESATNLTKSFRAASKAANGLSIFVKSFFKSFQTGPVEELVRLLQAANKETELVINNTAGYVRILKEAAKEQSYIAELARRNRVQQQGNNDTLGTLETRISRLKRAQADQVASSSTFEKVTRRIVNLEERRNVVLRQQEAVTNNIRKAQLDIAEAVERNIRASKASRQGSGFADFSQRAGAQTAIDKSIRRQREKLAKAARSVPVAAAPLMLPSSDMLNAAERGIKRIRSVTDQLGEDLDYTNQEVSNFINGLKNGANEAIKLPKIFDLVNASLKEAVAATQKLSNPIQGPGNDKGIAAYEERIRLTNLAGNLEQNWTKKLNSLRIKQDAARYRLQQKRIKKLANQQREADRKRAKRAESFALGVGFPLLFGGGAGAVAGGAAGSLLGDGFGGQIISSAVGQKIDEFVQKLSELADSLDSAENILDGLADAGIRVSKELKTAIKTLEDQGKFIQAYQIALGELERRFGPNAVQQLSNYDAANRTLGEQISKLSTSLQKELLPALTLVTQGVAGLLYLIEQSGGVLKFLANLVPGGRSVTAAADIAGAAGVPGVNDVLRRVTESPTNTFGFQGNTGAAAAAAKETEAAQKRSADRVREINQNQKEIDRAREEAARKELKHQQDVLKLVRDRKLLEAEIIEDQLRFQSAQRAFQQEQARLKAAGESALLNAEKEGVGAALNTLKTGGTSPGFSSPEQAFASKLAIEYDLIDKKVKNLGDTLLQSGAKTDTVIVATSAYRAELKAAAEEANRLERDRFETTDELFTRRAAYLKQETQILLETDEKAKLLLQKQLVYAKALKEVQDAGLDPTEGVGKAFIDATLANFDAANNKLSTFEQDIANLTKAVGVALKDAMETALVDTLAAAITGADDLNEKLQATAASLLQTAGKLLVNAGLGMIGNANQGNILGTLFGTRAGGGPVNEGLPYLVGEKGPELFVPGKSGTVVNNDDFADAAAAMTGASQAFADSGEALALATATRSSNTAAAAEASAMQTAETYFATGKSTVSFDTYRVGEMDVVTREDAIKIGMQSAKQAEANVYKGLRNMPAVRGRSGVK